jgi:predicted porin
MKKSLIALAVLAAAGTASAQSSVTLFGIVDATLQRVSNGNGGGSVTRLTNSGYNSSRLGFRGTEDLGGGMSASFWLEAGLANDDGQGAATSATNQAIGAFVPATGANAPVRSGTQGLTFNRRSTVSLAGGWGELRLGRDYTPQFWNLTVFDPFGTNGAGTTQTLNSIITGTTSVRASNSFGYFLPSNLGGFYGQLQHYRGENDSLTAGGAEDNGNGFAGRVGYAAGPLNVALALSRTDNVIAGVDTDIKQNNLGAQWDFGVAKLMGHMSWDSAGAVDGRGWLIGGLVPVGAGEIRVAYSQYRTDVAAGTDPRARKFALGYVHNLSKRTALYTTYARVRNNATSAAPAVAGAATAPGAGGSSSAFDLGVRHSF